MNCQLLWITHGGPSPLLWWWPRRCSKTSQKFSLTTISGYPWSQSRTPVSYTSIGAMHLVLWVMWIPFTTSLRDEGLCCSLRQFTRNESLHELWMSIIFSHPSIFNLPPLPPNLMAHLLPFVHVEAETWISVCSFCPCPALLVLLMRSCRAISLCSCAPFIGQH